MEKKNFFSLRVLGVCDFYYLCDFFYWRKCVDFFLFLLEKIGKFAMHYWASLWVLLSLCCSVCVVGESRLNCDAVRPFFEEQGFPATDIPKDPISCKYKDYWKFIQLIEHRRKKKKKNFTLFCEIQCKIKCFGSVANRKYCPWKKKEKTRVGLYDYHLYCVYVYLKDAR